MKNLFLIALAIFTVTSGFGQTFSKIYNFNQAEKALRTSTNSFLLSSQNGTDGVMIKLNQAGDTAWTRTAPASLNGGFNFLPRGFVEENNNSFVVGGYYSNSPIVVKIDSNGNSVNGFYYTTGYSDDFQIAGSGTDGNFSILYGMNNASTPIPMMSKINNSNGAVVWAKEVFASGYEINSVFKDVFITSGGYLIGLIKSTSGQSILWILDSNGNNQSIRMVNAEELNHAVENPDGTISIVGSYLAPNLKTDALHFTLDITDPTTPVVISSLTMGSSQNETANYVIRTSDMQYAMAVADESLGNRNFGLYKYNTGVSWAKGYGGNLSSTPTFLTELGNGDFIISGSSTTFSSGADRTYVVRSDSNGNTTGCQQDLSVQTDNPTITLTFPVTGAGSSNSTFTKSFDFVFTFGNDPVAIEDPYPLSSISAIHPLCTNGTGGADLTVTNGSSPYSYFWSSGLVAEDLTNAFAGNYSVEITDFNGCRVTDSVTLVDPSPILTSMTSIDVTCAGSADGSIDLTASGGTTGYTYSWSYNGETSEDLSGLSGGFYQVIVTDANGCSELQGISISEPNPLIAGILSTVNPSCYNVCDGQLDGIVTGGTGPYSYLWNDPLSQSTISANGLCSGNHLLSVTDANSCIAISNAILVEPSQLSASVSSTATECGALLGSAWAAPSGGTMPYNYLWTGGATTDSIVGLGQTTYAVTIGDANGCTYLDSVLIISIVNVQEICVVTVDSNNLNQINWTKPVVGNVEGYNIYRNIAGTYVQIGYNDYDSLSYFTDNTFGVDPGITSYRYKVSVVDTCGNESDLGGFHETIHLTANVGTSGEVNLIWDNYEGFAFGFYRILRDSTGTNNWEAIDSVPFSNFTFTDNDVPTIGADYIIEVVTPSLCDATKAIGDFNSSRSNRKSNVAGPNWINETEVIRDVYPNPFSDQIKVEIQGDIIESVRLIDIQGRIVIVESAINNSSYVVNANTAVTGTYILQVKTKYGQFNEVVTKSW
ncbi:MAG: hypothetical protein ACI9J3_003694 [Parvicellaceae bacterium]|jgi:hypothetical protein